MLCWDVSVGAIVRKNTLGILRSTLERLWWEQLNGSSSNSIADGIAVVWWSIGSNISGLTLMEWHKQ